jgi:hypothetical protein
MGEMKEYRRRERTTVTAVQLDLDTDGFTYSKWGSLQRCKRGDWLVDSDGEKYTVDAETFAKTYSPVSPGVWEKTSTVWAEQAHAAGTIRTKEGWTAYGRGDWLVFNDRERKDGWAVPAGKFSELYELGG